MTMFFTMFFMFFARHHDDRCGDGCLVHHFSAGLQSEPFLDLSRRAAMRIAAPNFFDARDDHRRRIEIALDDHALRRGRRR